MTTPKTRSKAGHPMQGAAPVVEPETIEHDPTDVRPTPPTPPAGPAPEVDMPLQTAENAVYSFKPGAGMSTLDLREVVLMQLMQLVNGPEVEKGALRHITLQGHRFEQLSDNARRWFEAVNNSPTPVDTEQPPKA